MPRAEKNTPSLLSDDELLAIITRDLRAIYTDVIRQPLPDALAGALARLELRAVDEKPPPGGESRRGKAGGARA